MLVRDVSGTPDNVFRIQQNHPEIFSKLLWNILCDLSILVLIPTKTLMFMQSFTTSFAVFTYTRDREPMAREPDVALSMTASGSLDIFLTRLLRMKLFL